MANGDICIKKNFLSDNDIKTNYVYEETMNGSRSIDTEILGKDGNVLFKNQQKFNVLGENHFESIENGIKYDIQYLEDSVIVTKGGKESIELLIGKNNMIPLEVLPMVKNLPGSAYFDMQNNNVKKIIISTNADNMQYLEDISAIVINPKMNNPEHVNSFLHELGHAKFRSNKTNMNADEVYKIFNKEIMNLTSAEEEGITYFRSGTIEEAYADTNALLYTQEFDPVLTWRTGCLQEKLPQTFAEIAKIMIAV